MQPALFPQPVRGQVPPNQGLGRAVCAHPLDRLAVRGQMGGLKQEFGQPRPGDRTGVLFPAWGPPGQDRNQRPGGQQAAQGRFPPVHGIVSLRLIGICVGLRPLHKTKVFPKTQRLLEKLRKYYEIEIHRVARPPREVFSRHSPPPWARAVWAAE